MVGWVLAVAWRRLRQAAASMVRHGLQEGEVLGEGRRETSAPCRRAGDSSPARATCAVCRWGAALAKVEAHATSDTCQFVVHGTGSGRLRKEVHSAGVRRRDALRGRAQLGLGGCTILFM